MPTVLNFLAVLLAILLLGGVVYLCLRSSSWFLHWLGETSIKAASRILGFFILTVGVQLILNGIAVAKVIRTKQNPETLTPQYASIKALCPLPSALCLLLYL